MNRFFLLLSFLSLAVFACKNDPKTTEQSTQTPADAQAGPTNLAGQWIALDFCAFANQYGSVIQAMNSAHLPYAYALTFNPAKPDSVECFNAVESWMLPVKYKDDTLEIVGARPGKSIFLIYHSKGEKDITMIDPTGPRVQMDHFIKSKAGAADGYKAFVTALNHHLFDGVFTPVGKNSTDKIMFTPGGFIQGWKNYDRYEVCSGGDCLVTGQDIDVMTMSDSKNQEKTSKMFGFRYNGQNDTLTIFNLINTNPAEKGAYKVGSPAFKFARKKSK